MSAEVERILQRVVEYGMTVGTAYVFAERGNKRGEERSDEDAKAQLDAIRTALLAVVPQWLPISEAPKDGRTLLIGRFNELVEWQTMRGQWMSDEYISDVWDEPRYGEAGWYETVVEADEIPNCWPIDPTHYQPLPQPPTPGGEKNDR